MRNPGRMALILLILLFISVGSAWAGDLPDLPKQELWIKVAYLVVGLIVIFVLSIFGINKILYSVMGMEADAATRFTVVIGIILAFLWFLFIFGRIFDTIINIAVGVLLFIAALVLILREKREPEAEEEDEISY